MLEQGERTARDASMREVIATSWPLVIGMLSYTAMGVADTLVVGWLGVTELAAVGLASTAMYLVQSLFLGSLNGVKVISAQATGARDPRLALDSAWYGAALAVVFGLVTVALGGLDGPIFALLGGEESVQGIARTYFGVRVLAAPFWFVLMALGDSMQGTGDTRTPMWLTLGANVLNIGLDFLLVFGWGPIPAMGAEGAAWATVLACALGMVAGVAVFLGRRPGRPSWRPRLVWELVKVGGPVGMRYMLNTVGFTVFTGILARAGERDLAAHQVAIRVISVSFLPGYGIGEAATVLVGQYLGMREEGLARRAFLNCLWLSMGVMSACGLVFLALPEPIARLFTDDPAVVEVACDLLRIAAFFQLFDAAAMAAVGGLNGAGDTRFTLLASLATNWGVMVPVAWGLGVGLEWGAQGTWLGLTAEIIVLAGLALWRFRRGDWMEQAVVQRASAA